MEGILVRAATAEDLGAIRAINTTGQSGVSQLTEPELDAIASGATRSWVAEVDSRVAGYLIAYCATDTYDGDEFAWFQQHFSAFQYVDQIAVGPSSRRGGVGSALYRAATDDALAHGYDALTCEVNLEPPNPTSLAFHRRLGFRQVGDMTTHDGRAVALLRLDVRRGVGAER